MSVGLTFTIAEFCVQARMSRKGFYGLRKRGEAPKILRVGSRIYVSQESAREWVRQREALELCNEQREMK